MGTKRPPNRRQLPADLVDDLVDAGSREHYADAALYDYEYRRRRLDVTFYRDIARRRLGELGRAGRVLELGAGSGRVTIPLARDGHEIVALDRSEPMLARLESRVAKLPAAAARRIRIARGDLCTFELSHRGLREQFDLVIAAFNVVEHLYTRGEVDACFRRVKDHLAPGGAFVFDVQLPDLAWLIRDSAKRWAKTRFTDPSTGRSMIYSTNHEYDPISQIAVIRLYYDPADPMPERGRASASRVVKLTQRKFFPAELEALVAHAGLRVTARYGDFSWAPLDETADSQVLVCEPPATPERPRSRVGRR